MHPIAPGFGGSVPSAIKRLHPDVKLHRVRWGGGFSEEYEADMILPEDPLFKTIGPMMVQEWEKEFGKNNHCLVDSFNEMSLPVDKEQCRGMLESFGKQWVYSTIPNMGGKTAFTGFLDYYASGHVEALRSTNRGRLIGYGFAPEGIENDEVLYELLSDAAWTLSKIDLDQWIPQYLKAR
jgi:hypothetical protein